MNTPIPGAPDSVRALREAKVICEAVLARAERRRSGRYCIVLSRDHLRADDTRKGGAR